MMWMQPPRPPRQVDSLDQQASWILHTAMELRYLFQQLWERPQDSLGQQQ